MHWSLITGDLAWTFGVLTIDPRTSHSRISNIIIRIDRKPNLRSRTSRYEHMKWTWRTVNEPNSRRRHTWGILTQELPDNQIRGSVSSALPLLKAVSSFCPQFCIFWAVFVGAPRARTQTDHPMLLKCYAKKFLHVES